MTRERSWNRLMAALMTVSLILLPLVLIAVPPFTRGQFPGPLTRMDAIVGFFVLVPLGFALVATYRVAQYRGLVGAEEDSL
ncbi:hypothetical protein [Halolamina sp. C58]|uniref:hypothetical protein n=1 Tax=Halolamina sp. C58 TaxID=3421640 RepID=UPI003EC121D9